MSGWVIEDDGRSASDEERAEFLARYRSHVFAHSLDVLAIMERADPNESRIHARGGIEIARLRPIYRARADTLAGRSAPAPHYPPTLARDVKAVADALEVADDQPVRIWGLTLVDGTSFIVFELERDRRIAGCVRSADQRIVRRLRGDPDPRR